MKKDREETYEHIQIQRFTDLLKLYSSIEDRVHTLLNREGVQTRDIEDTIKIFMEVSAVIDKEVSNKLKGIQRKEMYSYLNKEK